MTDPYDVLRSHVRSIALLEHPDTEPDDLVAQITGVTDPIAGATRDGASVIAFPHHRSPGSSGSFRSNGSPRRRRWLVAAGVSAIVVVGGAGVAAFVGTRPSAPSAGVVCRASVSNSSAIVIEPTADPVAACADLWALGDLPDIDQQGSGEIPRLVACVGSRGTLEVLPLPEYWSCADAGLADADITGITDDPVVRLQAALVDRVNAGGCRTSADVAAIAREVLDAMDLATWSVNVADPSSACATVALDVSTSQVIVRPHPSAQEKP